MTEGSSVRPMVSYSIVYDLKDSCAQAIISEERNHVMIVNRFKEMTESENPSGP